MPRYCAVKVCRNRGGAASGQNNKKFSFYPFPLRDKPRLQRWVDNMKRGEWTPSQHQYLCSEHFAEECFDIRWGIRYLKTTAIPTVFPPKEDGGEEKDSAIKRSSKANPSTSDFEPTNPRPPNIAAENTEIFEPPPVETCETSSSGGKQTAPCLPLPQSTEPHSEEHADPTAQHAALGQAFSFGPVEMVTDAPAGCVLEESRSHLDEHTHIYEHSYCRRDTDKNHLWNKILTLHAKILELDRREERSVAQIHTLRTEIAFLRTVFEEKQKVLENCVSSILV
ncbi:THAP domain-containing protein 5-like [Brachionichthys hirsutus]|uniref:THAP domain-containing protein 5-like n=1 Tax=Brachionichthys hirsutus TaxID=412623 RepID=UPI003604E50E